MSEGPQRPPPAGSIARLLDAAIGETREALVHDGRVVALNIVRASEQGARARWGELYAARVQRIDRRLRGGAGDEECRCEHGDEPERGGDGHAEPRKLPSFEFSERHREPNDVSLP